jgi:hypothetical protein
VDRFAFTANNISYALAGDMLDYWGFFPAEEGWGRLPVMGFGDVIRSCHPEVSEGERVFGFFPMSRHLVVQADRVNPMNFVDAASHRKNHAPAYIQYSRVKSDPMYDADREDQLALLRGLFMTSFLVDDFIEDNGFFGAEAFVVGSASSKTAIALGFLLSRRGSRSVTGLTSPRNLEFVESLGCYDRVLPYADLESIPADVPTVFVDMSGDAEVVNGLHHHLGDNMKYSCAVGATHWESGPRESELPGAQPVFFFAPGQIQKRSKEWGPAGLQERLGSAWRDFDVSTDRWLTVHRASGREAVERVYRETLEGRTRPSDGHVLSLWD